MSNIDEFWTEPSFANFLQRLARFSRLIVFDKRGTGLSDRVDENNLPTLEQRMDDVRAVMDAAGSRRAALLGISEGGPMCILFAATYPERTAALMTFGLFARRSPRLTIRGAEARKPIAGSWRRYAPAGARPVGRDRRPVPGSNERYRQWWTRYLVRSASPSAVLALVRMNAQIDVRGALPAIRVPTLIMHRSAIVRSRRGRQPLHGGFSRSRMLATSSIRAKIICPGPATPNRCWAISRSSSPGRGMRPISTACSPP